MGGSVGAGLGGDAAYIARKFSVKSGVLWGPTFFRVFFRLFSEFFKRRSETGRCLDGQCWMISDFSPTFKELFNFRLFPSFLDRIPGISEISPRDSEIFFNFPNPNPDLHCACFRFWCFRDFRRFRLFLTASKSWTVPGRSTSDFFPTFSSDPEILDGRPGLRTYSNAGYG